MKSFERARPWSSAGRNPKPMLNLNLGARPDERFHLQTGAPVPTTTRIWWLYKRVTWSNLTLPDGSPGRWSSWWLIGNAVHWYTGTCKCDGTRTRMYWAGQLDDGHAPRYRPDPAQYVMTTTEKEKFSVRFFVDPGEPSWDTMGGS